jgi:predicted phage terminase large subunit-like protein
MTVIDDLPLSLEAVEAEIRLRERQQLLQQEARALTNDLELFVRQAWHELEPLTPFMPNWHITAICQHLEAVSKNEIKRLQIWVPPGSCKSRLVSVFWPAWEWSHHPHLRYWTGSYDIRLSKELTAYSRDLMMSEWYKDRFGHVFTLQKTSETWLTNDLGGHRLSTSPESSGSGVHGHRIIVDDPLNALDSAATTKSVLEKANLWYSETLATRGLKGYAEVIIMQRLHENDFAAHALNYGDWEILCLPEKYEKQHPYAWQHDPRQEGELLWPDKRDETEHTILTKKLASKAAGQLQQRPASREGAIIRRADWRYYPPAFLDQTEQGDTSKLPRFTSIIMSWDTTFKNTSTSDYVAGGCWGIKGANRYLLKTFHQQASLSETKTAMTQMRKWALDRWPHLPVRTLIEKSANGTEIIEQLKREITGVTPIPVTQDKMTRAEACEPDFNSENVWVPGQANAAGNDYHPTTPAWVQELVEQCSSFPHATHDDLVDMTTMALNWARTHTSRPLRTVSATARTAAAPPRHPFLIRRH